MAVRPHGEGSYWKRPSGTWRYRVVVDGRYVDGNGTTRKAAREDARSKIRRLGTTRNNLTINALFTDWLREGAATHGLRPTTFDQYVSLIRTRVIPALGDRPVQSVTRSDLDELIRSWTGSSSTRRSAYAATAKLFAYAVDHGLLMSNPVRECPRPANAHTHHRIVSSDDVARLFEAARGHRWEIAVWLAFGLGLRRGELLGLTWADVDTASSTIEVTRRSNVVRTSSGLTAGPPKTRSGVRRVPLSRPLLEALSQHRVRQEQIRDQAPLWEDSGHILTTHLGGVVEPRALSRVWRQWALEAGLSDTGMHVSRHYAATVLLSSGQASVADVAATLGHDPAVLLHTYAVAVAEGQRNAVDVLGGTLAKAAEVTSEVTSSK